MFFFHHHHLLNDYNKFASLSPRSQTKFYCAATVHAWQQKKNRDFFFYFIFLHVHRLNRLLTVADVTVDKYWNAANISLCNRFGVQHKNLSLSNDSNQLNAHYFDPAHFFPIRYLYAANKNKAHQTNWILNWRHNYRNSLDFILSCIELFNLWYGT